MKKAINLATIFFSIVGIYIISTAKQFPSLNKNVPGPGFFPIILGTTLIILSIMLFSINRKEIYEYKQLIGKKFSKTYISIGVTLVYILLLEKIGFLFATIPFLVFLIYLFNYRKIVMNLVISSSITYLIYYLFNTLLNVPLPEAVLF